MASEVQYQQSFEDDTDKPKHSSLLTDFNSSTGFDCSICLDSAQDAVVTFCGHFYCWPCMYKWIHQQTTSPELPEDRVPQCPVCKAEVSERTLIPLYGRGQSNIKATDFGPAIPSRPRGSSCRDHTSVTTTQLPAQRETHHNHSYNYASGPEISLAAGSTAFHPVISMFGDMIYARPSGNPQAFYSYTDSYSVDNRRNWRARRRVMKADQSLSRMSLFLCCCLLFCLLFF